MKHPIYKLAIYAVVFSQSAQVFAQQPKVMVPGYGVPMVTASAGTYEIRTQDSSQILQAILNRIAQVQDSDLQFIESTRTGIDAAYNDLAKLIVSGTFAQMSNKARLSQSVSAEDYLTVLTQIQEKQIALESKINSLNSITQGILPSQGQLEVAGNTQSLIGYRAIDMSNLVEFYNSRIGGLLSLANSMPMKVTLPTGGTQVISSNTLSPSFDVPLYSQADINNMTAQINDLRLPSDGLMTLMDNQGMEARRLVQAFVTNYGSSERYRFKDERDLQARAHAYKQIQDIFWSRSYLRVKYGMRLGAVQPVAYRKRIGNIDKFLVLTESLRQFRQERAVTEVDLANAAENIRNVLEVVDDRSAQILGKDANPSILIRANSFLTFLGGQTQTAEALLMIMQLVAADIAEEQMMTSGGGLAKLREFYKTRYQSTNDMKTYYSNLKCGLDSLANCQAGAYQDVISNQGGLRTVFNEMNLSLMGNAASLDQANRIEQQLKNAMIANGGASAGNINQRADDL